MKRKHKSYSRPRRPYDKARIEEEAGIVKEFGLKSKREIWKADARVSYFRARAKKLVQASEHEKKVFFENLKKIGLNVNSISDALSLNKNDYLNRRLQTVVFRKGLVPTAKTARQMIVHKNVLVDGKVINIPSYVVPVELEDKITLKISRKPTEPKKEKKNE